MFLFTYSVKILPNNMCNVYSVYVGKKSYMLVPWQVFSYLVGAKEI